MSKQEMTWFMRFVTTLAIAGCLLMVGVYSAYAQPAGQSSDLAKALNLTPKQTPEVQAIIDAERREVQALREAMRAKMDALHDATNKKLAKVLNTEQMGRYAEWREANRPPRPEGGPPPRRDGNDPPPGMSPRRPSN